MCCETLSFSSNHDVDAINELVITADVDKSLSWATIIFLSAYGLLTGQDPSLE